MCKCTIKPKCTGLATFESSYEHIGNYKGHTKNNYFLLPLPTPLSNFVTFLLSSPSQKIRHTSLPPAISLNEMYKYLENKINKYQICVALQFDVIFMSF